VSFATVMPWALFAFFYFGSPIPHSFIAKIYLQDSPVKNFDHSWIWKFLLSDNRIIFGMVAFVSLAFLRGYKSNERLAVVTLFSWFLFHVLAFSLMSLGDYYPWYLTVLVPPIIILSCAFAGQLATRNSGLPYRVAVGAATVLILWFTASGPARATYKDLASGHPVTSWDAFENDRRLAGIFLNQYADKNELLECGFGWPAFESKLPVNDTGLLNSKIMRQPVAYQVYHGLPWDRGTHPPELAPGYSPLATFNLTSDLYPGWSWFTVFGRPDSSIARAGARYLQYRLSELPPPEPYSSTNGLEFSKVVETNLAAHPPSGATFTLKNARQPVHIVFTPAFDPAVPIDTTDGVTFEVWNGDVRIYQRHLLPTETPGPVVLTIANASTQESVKVSFVTTAGLRGDRTNDWAFWRAVKFVAGDAFIDLWRLRDQKLMEEWARYNPQGVSNKVDQLARALSRPTLENPIQVTPPESSQLTYSGAVDLVSCDNIGGWVWSPQKPEKSLPLEIYVDNQILSQARADLFRKDLADAGIGTGNYGFIYQIPAQLKDGQTHVIKVKVQATEYEVGFFKSTPHSISCNP
ncbi:MAG TPA: hypothetical protein VMS31_19220, partial [Pyrinomonadaceae bacterium]|nr:hypothetical protein [Pyrinomonadaceae bacterium]